MTAPTIARLRQIRPTKNAAGMSFTAERKASMGKGRNYKGYDPLRLMVYGTCDPLATSIPAIGKRKCPTCNGTGRHGYELSERGKLRLRLLRKKRSK